VLERELEREQVVAAANVEDRDLDRNRDRDRDRVAAHEADPSPHFDGRAQPGDVVGFETGGERTHIGETREDENKRRSDAERAYRKETEK
jgi:hypothetical protein